MTAINRRRLLSGLAALSGGMLAMPMPATAQDQLSPSALRGSLSAEEFGVRPDAPGDQSSAFTRMLAQASDKSAPIFLPPGNYHVSNIRLPRETRLFGVQGATRLIHYGNGSLLSAQDAAMVHLEGLTFDGAGRPLGERAKALVEMRRVTQLVIDSCNVTNSAASGLVLEQVSGRVERCTISNAAAYALYCVEAGRMRIAFNTITNCADGGILVHRWATGEDGTIITGNRVEKIGARSGGTGQYGNGINIFRADNVIVSDNHIADCAFSAIRANSASNIHITGNQCLRCGETAIYSEFAFEGALISSNIVDTAAIGISIANLNEGGRMAVCSGNIVRNLVDHGPYEPFEAMGFGVGISAEADTAITGNVIDTASRCGVLLGWGPYLRNVVATGNMLRGAREGFAISVVEGVGPVLIADNIIDGAERAFGFYRWRDAVAADPEKLPGLRIERNIVS